MKPKTFPLLLPTLIFLIHKCLSLNPNYVACEPFRCGKLNISYPFYVPQEQPPNCGSRGFNVICNRENQTIIHLSGDDYIINNISYQDLTINVSNSISDPCLLLYNLTFGPYSKFNFTTHTKYLLLLKNCKPNAKNYSNITCGSTNNTLLRYEKDFDQEDVRNCETTVEVPYERPNNYDIEDLVRKGITLNYIANNCSVCQNSGWRCGLSKNTSEFFCFCPDRDHRGSCKQQSNGKRLAIILGTVLPGSMSIILALIFYWRQRNNKSDTSTRSMSFTHIKDGVTIFSYTQLEEATNNFDTSQQLGEGGFGIVYYGKLKDGREVAVKRLYEKSYKRIQQFNNEIKILTDLRHQNLVTLYGYTCHQSRELLLVYEYIPNGTVSDHLHGQQSEKQILPWSTRIRIAIETATALYYLHYKDIIHRDVKTNNILLDNSFSVKVADFGLSRLLPADVTHVSTAPQGTPGYVDPDYYQCYQLTDKSDVYSFGVVLIELISSLPAVDVGRERHEINLSNYAMKRIESCAVAELVDTNLGFETDLKVARMITLVAELAYRCLQNERELRPSMEEVLQTLKRIESEPWKSPASPVSVMDNCLNTSKSSTSTTSKSS